MSHWLDDNETCLISIEHRNRLRECYRKGYDVRFRERANNGIYIIDYGVENTWFQLLRTEDEKVRQVMDDQIERYLVYLESSVKRDYSYGGFR